MPEMMIMLFTKPRLQGRDYWSKEGGDLVALPPRKCFNMSALCGRGYGSHKPNQSVLCCQGVKKVKNFMHAKKENTPLQPGFN